MNSKLCFPCKRNLVFCLPVLILQFVFLLAVTQTSFGKESVHEALLNCASSKKMMCRFLSSPDSLPKSKESFTIRRSNGDEDVLLNMVDGEITRLEINGKIIEENEYPQYQSYIDELTKTPLTGEKNSFSFHFNHWDAETNPQDMWQGLDSMFRDLSLGTGNGPFGPSAQFRFHSGNFDIDSLMEQMSVWTKKWQEEFPSMENKMFRTEDDFERDDWITENDFSADESPKEFTTTLGNALNKDGLLIPGQENEIELNYKSLKINGEKQPENIFQKYKRLFESSAGTPLQKKSKIKFLFTGKQSTRKFRVY